MRRLGNTAFKMFDDFMVSPATYLQLGTRQYHLSMEGSSKVQLYREYRVGQTTKNQVIIFYLLLRNSALKKREHYTTLHKEEYYKISVLFSSRNIFIFCLKQYQTVVL